MSLMMKIVRVLLALRTIDLYRNHQIELEDLPLEELFMKSVLQALGFDFDCA